MFLLGSAEYRPGIAASNPVHYVPWPRHDTEEGGQADRPLLARTMTVDNIDAEAAVRVEDNALGLVGNGLPINGVHSR